MTLLARRVATRAYLYLVLSLFYVAVISLHGDLYTLRCIYTVADLVSFEGVARIIMTWMVS